GSFGCTNLRWFVRGATEITGPAELSNGFVSRQGPCGPPPDGSEATRPLTLFLARRHRCIDGRPASHRSDNASSKLPITYSATIVAIVGVVGRGISPPAGDPPAHPAADCSHGRRQPHHP